MYAQSNVFAAPASAAPVAERQSFLRKVGGLTFAGLTGSFLVSIATAFLLVTLGESLPILFNSWVQMGVILGSFAVVQVPARSMAHSEGATKYLGFALGTTFQGIAMSYLLLAAAMVGQVVFGNPFLLILQAMGITMLMAVGMLAYLLTGPKDLSMVKGALAMLSLPMLVLMVVSFVFPIGGPIGTALTALFVVVSAGGVLYQLNQVMHRYPTHAPVPAAYGVTIGLLVLYWNVLSLLMRLNRD